MTSKKRLTLALTIIGAASALICSSIAGAIEVPSGINIAAAIVIGLSLLIEAPLTAMALAKHKSS